ncbi:hydroxycinnamoyltransferase 4-like [Phragmites australis]|uniref:hydroxycinnamoyltransferase 4-like n=1 Tax=Phragmites australis TaxID=29695 RepID=UPI002D7851FA|nr:hydroxycinnamoyltransferase 4-like [Phragmites australis]
MAVEVVKSELVAPSEPTPRRALWLSNLDLAARNGYTPTVYFFRRPEVGGDRPQPDFFSADVLRAALAGALVPFYPFAGRLGAGRDGRAEIDCNAEGALFVVARSSAALDEFEGFAPSTAMCDLFVPTYDSAGPGAPLLMLQVTFFRCGGVALGTAMHHFVIDGRSAFNFIRTWASIASGTAGAAVPPSLERTPLRARPLPSVLFDHTHEYGSHASGPTAAAAGGKAEYANAILRVTGAQAAALRARAGAAPRVSTFRALVAHVWRCACAARALAPDAESRLYTMVDMRARLSPPLPEAYFGNAVVRTSVSARVGDLLGGPLGFAARRLRAATGHGDEYARSLVDYLEAADMGALPRGRLPSTDLRVISWLGMPSHDADFGWGEPALLAPALMYYTGFVYLLSCPGKDGGVAVAVALEPERMERFKELFFEELAEVTE